MSDSKPTPKPTHSSPKTSVPYNKEVTTEEVKKTPLVSGDAAATENKDLNDSGALPRSSLQLNKDDYTPKSDEAAGSTDETRPTDPEYPMQNQISTPQNKR